MHGWRMEGWTKRWMTDGCQQTDDRWLDEQMMDGKIERWIMNGQTDGQMMDGGMEGWMIDDKWVDG